MQVIPGLDRIGGAERQAMLLARGMRQRGWQVSVVALAGSGGDGARELREAGVEFVSLGMRKGLADPRGWLRFNHWLRSTAPDVVHAHLPHAALLARWSRLAAPIPVLVDTLHSSATGTACRRLGYRLSDFLSDRVTAVSEAAACAHRAAAMVRRGKLVVLPNGVEPERWRSDGRVRAAVRRELGFTDEFLWLAAGRLEPVKDYPTLLRAMANLPETARLVVAGGGSLLADLSALAARLGVAGRVHFLGFVPEPERWMQAADGFVLSSRWEGLPMALIEASACGLPAVATDAAGVREVLPDSPLVPAADPAALAAAMARLMRTPEEMRSAMGSRARWFVVERFALAAVLNRWERLYENLLADRGNAGILAGMMSDS